MDKLDAQTDEEWYNAVQNNLGLNAREEAPVNSRCYLKTNNKMLLFLKLFPEENYPDKKQVNAAGNRSIIFYRFPCRFHFTAPVNIIKNKN